MATFVKNHEDMNRKGLLLGLVSFFSTFFAFGQKPEVFSTKEGAIRGFDPVAFFTESKPIVGKNEFTYRWKEADWHFVNKENLEAFQKDPEKYAPQYGGYCAYGVAKDHKSPTLTETWTVVDGKLYFNYNLDVKKLWMADQPGMIEQANKNWVELRKK